MELLIWFVSLLTAVKAQNCLQAANGGSLSMFSNRGDRVRITHRHQAIVASYQFICCGNVTAWGADVEQGGGGDQNQYDINFQVWRPSPAVETDGCYSMVGENIFTSVTLTDSLIRETPSVNEQISFRPGYVVGFFVVSNRERDPERHGIVLDTTYNTETVWYGSVDAGGVVGDPNCPFPVGTQTNRFLRTSTNAAPVISVSYSSFDCPPLIIPSTPPTQPSPTSSVLQTSSSGLSPSPTPTPDSIGDGQLPRTVQPDQTLPSMATPPTTNGVVDQTTSDSLPSVEQPNNNIGLISSTVTVMALFLVITVIALAFILAGCFMRKSPRLRVGEKKLSTRNFATNSGCVQEMEDVAYDTVADFQASGDVRRAQSADYNYITGDEVVTHTNEAYITSTGGMKMSENEAYEHTTYPGEEMEDVEYDMIDSIQTPDVLEVQSADYNYITGDEVFTHTNETSTGGMEMSETVAYGQTENNHRESNTGEGIYYVISMP